MGLAQDFEGVCLGSPRANAKLPSGVAKQEPADDRSKAFIDSASSKTPSAPRAAGVGVRIDKRVCVRGPRKPRAGPYLQAARQFAVLQEVDVGLEACHVRDGPVGRGVCRGRSRHEPSTAAFHVLLGREHHCGRRVRADRRANGRSRSRQ